MYIFHSFFPFVTYSLTVLIQMLLIMSNRCLSVALTSPSLRLPVVLLFCQLIFGGISKITGCHQPAPLTVSCSSQLWLMRVISTYVHLCVCVCERAIRLRYSTWWRVTHMLSPVPCNQPLPPSLPSHPQPLNFSFGLCVQPSGLSPLQSSHYLSSSVTSNDGLAIASWHLDILLFLCRSLMPQLPLSLTPSHSTLVLPP